MLIGRFQNKHTAAGIFRLDRRFPRHLAPYSFSEKVPNAFDSCGRADIAQHPLHGASLDGDISLAQITYQLAFFHIHLGAVIGLHGGIGGYAQVPLILDDLEGAQCREDGNVVVIQKIRDLIHRTASIRP